MIPSHSAGATMNRYYLKKELQHGVGFVVVVSPETYHEACLPIDEAVNDDLPPD